MTIKKIASRTTPLCFLSDGRLLCHHRQEILVMRGDTVDVRIPILVDPKESLLGWSRALSRLLRLGVRVAESLDENRVILCIGNTLYELDVDSGKLSEGWYCGSGIRPLIMTTVKGINGIEDGVYFGGYLGNREKKPVNIYHRIGVDQWEVVFSFPQGAINHIHNVVPDPYRKCLWVFTGDFGDSAAIWRVTDGFSKVERVVFDNQNYRGCVAYSLPEGLLYATDAPYAENHIYLMNTKTFATQSVFPLHGSCIFGCKWKDRYVFSSTVEGDGRSGGRWRLLYHGNRGAGIKDDFAHLYVGNLSDGFKEIYKEKKDCLSFLFQFGLFKFPYGENNTDTLFFQPMSTKRNDLCLMVAEEGCI